MPLPGVSWAFPDTRNAWTVPVMSETNGRGRDMADRTKITVARARAFMPADGREAVLWDSLAPGFGLRVRPNGRKTWIVHRRRTGAVVKKTLGTLGALSVEDARRGRPHTPPRTAMGKSLLAGARLPQAEPAQKLRDTDAVMAGDALQDARRRLRADRIVQRDHLVVLAVFLRCDTHMRATLTHPLVTQSAKRRHERGAAVVAREPQAIRTPSRSS